MDNSIPELLKFLTEISLKKFFVLLILLAAGFLCFSLFERYTSSFRLARLEKSAELVGKLNELDKQITPNSTRELVENYHELLKQTSEAINQKPVSLDILPGTLRFSMDIFWKFLAGAGLWIFAAAVAAIFEKKKDKLRVTVALLILATMSGVVGVWVPAIGWPWFHIFGYPFLFVIGLIIVLLPVGYIQSKLTTKKPVHQEREHHN